MKWIKHHDYQIDQTYLYVIKTQSFLNDKNEYWNGYIKIGVAGNVPQRLKNLQTGCPYKLEIQTSILMYSDHAARLVERYLHHKFRADRAHGEWFRFSSKVEKYIYGNFKRLGLPGFEEGGDKNG